MSQNKILTDDLRVSFIESPIIELFELDLNTSLDSEDDGILRFHAGLDGSLEEVSFKGNLYQPMRVFLDGVDVSSDNASGRPTLTIANVTNILKDLLNDYNFSFESLIGKRLTRIKTFEKYLDSGSESLNPFEFPRASFYVDRISSKNSIGVSFELTSPYDVEGVKLPKRITVGKYCSWMYQGYERHTKGGCIWKIDNTYLVGDTVYTLFFDTFDRPIVSLSLVTSLTSAYDAEVSYNIDSVITFNGKYYRSEVVDNLGTDPVTSTFWKELIVSTNFSQGTSYSKDDVVVHDNKAWRCLINTNTKVPGDAPAYWIRIDLCSKELSGCKSRFQARITPEGIPSASKDTSKTLPFGGFPGSEKFN